MTDAQTIVRADPLRRHNRPRFGFRLFAGLLARRKIKGYLGRTFVVHASISMIALGIDLSGNWEHVLSLAPSAALSDTVLQLLWYASLRLVDITFHLLGIATFLGVLWWEVLHTRSLERTSTWNTGQSVFQGFVPVLIFAAFIACFQTVISVHVYPTVVRTQIDAGLGVLGRRYERDPSWYVTWGAIGKDLFAARIEYGDKTVMRDLALYRLSDEGRLEQVITAESATSVMRSGLWDLQNARQWDIDASASRNFRLIAPGPSNPGPGLSSEITRLSLNMDPELFKYNKMAAKYIPQNILKELLQHDGPGFTVSDYRTWLQFRYSFGISAGLMALLAATVAVFVTGRVISFSRYFFVFVSGYVAHVLLKVCVTVGELGVLHHFVASWLPPALIAATVGALQIYAARNIVIR